MDTKRVGVQARKDEPPRPRVDFRSRGDQSMGSKTAAVLVLQHQAGNRAVNSLLGGGAPVVQRMLIPAGQQKAGRVPEAERESLIKFLMGNGFERSDRDKARSNPMNKQELENRFKAVKDIDLDIDNFLGKEPWKVRKRNKLKVQLEAEYLNLLGFAEVCRDEADDLYMQNVADAAAAIAARGPGQGKSRLFKNQQPWNTYKTDDIPAFFVPQLGAFTNLEVFTEAVFKRANQILSPAKPPPVGLTPQQQQELDDEKQGVNAQLGLWANVAPNAPGCNAQGTWGTSKGGAGGGFSATHLSEPVWRKLKQWWVRKLGAYVTPSETSTYSLKMWRDVGDQNLSPTFNYHVYVP